MKRLAPILGFLFILIIPATILMADLCDDLWKPYMSEPRNQDRDIYGPQCYEFATIFSVEALYNYYYYLGDNKVMLTPNTVSNLINSKTPPDEWMTET